MDARHTCPEFCALPHRMRFAAKSKSQSGAMITGLLPPSSSVTGVSISPAFFAITRPIRAPPVKKIWFHLHSSSPLVSTTAPVTTLYASGSRYFGTSFAMSAEVVGVDSDGFITAGHPAAIAPTSGWNVRMIG